MPVPRYKPGKTQIRLKKIINKFIGMAELTLRHSNR